MDARNGWYISLRELLKNVGEYMTKEIRPEQDIVKMLKTGSFNFKKN